MLQQQHVVVNLSAPLSPVLVYTSPYTNMNSEESGIKLLFLSSVILQKGIE